MPYEGSDTAPKKPKLPKPPTVVYVIVDRAGPRWVSQHRINALHKARELNKNFPVLAPHTIYSYSKSRRVK